MKKLLAFIISLNFAIMPAYCTITDDFAGRTLDKNLKIKTPAKPVIQDDFADKTLNKNIQIKPYKNTPISDSFAESNKNKNITITKQGYVREKLPELSEKNKFQKKVVILDTNSAISVPVKICKKYSVRYKNFDEGDYIDFVTTKDITIGKTTYPKGIIVKGRIENISQNQAMGVPSDLIVGSFKLDNILLSGEINKTGANRSLWVRPCVYGLVLFFCIGLLFIPIRGGHAKIRESETYTLYTVK